MIVFHANGNQTRAVIETLRGLQETQIKFSSNAVSHDVFNKKRSQLKGMVH